VARARAAADTPCAGQTPVNLCSGRVGSARGRTVEALVGFIAVGAGADAAQSGARGVERLGVLWRCQGASNTWLCYSA
jgi:hypothetical protein